MSLDLQSTALQIDDMALLMKSRESDRLARLGEALRAVDDFDPVEYERKRRDSLTTLHWAVPEVASSPGEAYAPPPVPEEFSVVASDGSHIDVDRHIPARCFLINIGVSALTYGAGSDARLSNSPRLYASDEELVLRDPHTSYREQAIQGAVLGAKRMVDEAFALVEAVRQTPSDAPTLALMDGSLVMLGLVGQGLHEFVMRQLAEEGFARALDQLREIGSRRTLSVASYISLPNSAEVVNALRLQMCPYDSPDCAYHCREIPSGRRPCDAGAAGVRDRDLFQEILEPGERSATFVSASALVSDYYRGHQVHFCYLHTGNEIARLEVPSWVAEDEGLMGLAHSLAMDQCRRGPGYPIALMEAHEQAVVTGSDRRHFTELIEGALTESRLPVYSSEKSFSKRARWL